MGTANLVPRTRDLDGSSIEIVKESVGRRLPIEALQRFRAADGWSFARSLAFQVVLTTIPGLILAVGVAIRVGEGRYQTLLASMADSVAPGPAGDVIRAALDQGADASGSTTAVIASAALAFLVSGTAAMAQLQRGASRIYGIESDRPTGRRHLVALGLMASSGVLVIAAFLALAVGQPVADLLASEGLGYVWTFGRFPLGVVAVVGGLVALFKVAPNRVQPSFRWLVGGAGLSLVLWVTATILLSLYLNASTNFGDTYGPLAGFVGVMLWAQFSSLAVLAGLAMSAQLEAHRAGVPNPTNPLKQTF